MTYNINNLVFSKGHFEDQVKTNQLNLPNINKPTKIL